MRHLTLLVLTLFLVLRVLTHAKGALQMPGLTTGVFLIGYGLARSFSELFRQFDPGHAFSAYGFTPGIVYSIPMILLGIWPPHPTDIYVSISLFIGYWAALFACCVIAYNGVRLLRAGLNEVMDVAPPPEVDTGEPLDVLAALLRPPLQLDAMRLQEVQVTWRDDAIEPPLETRLDLDVRISDVAGDRPVRLETTLSALGLADRVHAELTGQSDGEEADLPGFDELKERNWIDLPVRGAEFAKTPFADFRDDPELRVVADESDEAPANVAGPRSP